MLRRKSFLIFLQIRLFALYSGLHRITSAASDFPSARNIIKYVRNTPEQYLVHFHTTTNFISQNLPFEQYKLCFPCAFLFFTPEYSSRPNQLRRFQARYSQQYNVIIMFDGNVISFANLHFTEKYALLSSTVYIFYYHMSLVPLSKSAFLYPALKIAINKGLLNLGKHEYGLVICERYCVSCTFAVDRNFIVDIRDPVKFHKSLFWNGHERSIQALRIGTLRYFQRFKREGSQVCWKLIADEKANDLAHMCESLLLNALTLVDVHNITLDTYFNPTSTQIDAGTSGQLLQSYGFVGHVPNHLISGHVVAGSAHFSPIYCVKNLHTVTYKLWTNAFPVEIWVLVNISVVVVIIQFWRMKMAMVIHVVGMTLGQGVSVKSVKILHFLVFTYFIRCLFENTLTSVIMVPSEPNLYRNLHEMILDNVKLLFTRGAWPEGESSLKTYFLSDFRQNRVEHLINQSFQEIPDNLANDNDMANKYLIRGKYAALSHGNWIKIQAYVYGANILKATHSELISCHILKQRLNSNLLYFVLYTMNRDWLMSTLERLRDAGLSQVWNNWAEHRLYLREKSKFRRIEQKHAGKNFQVVEFQHCFVHV